MCVCVLCTYLYNRAVAMKMCALGRDGLEKTTKLSTAMGWLLRGE